MPKKLYHLSQAWFVWGLAATFYFSDYLARVAPGVMHKELQADFGINEVGFTTLTSFFLYPLYPHADSRWIDCRSFCHTVFVNFYVINYRNRVLCFRYVSWIGVGFFRAFTHRI